MSATFRIVTSAFVLVLLCVSAPLQAAILGSGGVPDPNYSDGGNSMQWWLNAGAGVTGNPVTNWADQSNNSFDASEATNGPAFNNPATNHNGQPALAFDGSNDQLSAGDVLDQGTGSFTMFTVFRSAFRTVSANEMLVEKRDGSDRFTLYLRPTASSPGLNFVYGDGSSAVSTAVGSDYSQLLDNNPHISVGVVDFGDTAYHYLDGLSEVDTADISSLTVGQSNANNLYIGRGQNSSAEWDGSIAEVLMYQGALTTSEINEVGYYLQDKYGVDGSFTPVPEPSTGLLLVLGTLCMLRKRRRGDRNLN